jgi:2-oxoglutarate dehydrogenase E1 component
MWGKTFFTRESIIPALDTLIERAAEMGVEQFVMASWPFEYFGKHIWKSTQDIFGELVRLR